MAVRRFRISFDADIAGVAQGRANAGSEGVSAGLAESARRHGRRDELLGAILDFEQEHGVITERELAVSQRRLRLGGTRRSLPHKLS